MKKHILILLIALFAVSCASAPKNEAPAIPPSPAVSAEPDYEAWVGEWSGTWKMNDRSAVLSIRWAQSRQACGQYTWGATPAPSSYNTSPDLMKEGTISVCGNFVGQTLFVNSGPVTMIFKMVSNDKLEARWEKRGSWAPYTYADFHKKK